MNLKLGQHQSGLQICARATIFALSIFSTVALTLFASVETAQAHVAPFDFGRLFCADLVPANYPSLTASEMMRWDEAIREVAERLPIDPQALDIVTLTAQPQRVVLPFNLADLFTISKQDSHIYSQMQLSSFAHRSWSAEQLKRAQELLRELALQQSAMSISGAQKHFEKRDEKIESKPRFGLTESPVASILDMGLSERAVISRFDLKHELAVTSEGVIDLKKKTIDRRNRIQAEFEMRSTFLFGQSTVSANGRFVAIKNFADPTQLKLEIWDRETKKSWSLPIAQQTRTLLRGDQQLILVSEGEEVRTLEIDLAKLAVSETGLDSISREFLAVSTLRSVRPTISALENRRFDTKSRFVHSMILNDGRSVGFELFEKEGLHARVVNLLTGQILLDAVSDLGPYKGMSIKVLGVNQARNGLLEFVIEREVSNSDSMPFEAGNSAKRKSTTIAQTILFGINLVKGEMKLNGLAASGATANSFDFFGWTNSDSYQVVRTRMDQREMIYVLSRYRPEHGTAFNRLAILASEDLAPILKEYSQVDFLEMVEDKSEDSAELILIAKNPDTDARALFRLSPSGELLVKAQPLAGDKVLAIGLRNSKLEVYQELRVKGVGKQIVRTSFPSAK